MSTFIHNKQTQTDIIFEDESDAPWPIIFCWQDSFTQEASTQTSIPQRRTNNNDSNKKMSVTPSPVPVKRKSIAVGADEVPKIGFEWFKDIEDDKALKQLGGISLSFFKELLEFIKPGKKGQPTVYIAVKEEDRLLLFLMKMKLGLGFSALSCIFKIARQTAANIFFEILETIFIYTKTWIFWPSKDAVQQSMPISFKNYPNCRAIIDLQNYVAKPRQLLNNEY